MRRGQWAKDVQHGFGLQWRHSGQMYIGAWRDNKEHGAGVHFQMRGARSLYNPHSGQSLFVGAFSNGCPLAGLLIECEDYKALTLSDFAPQFSLPAAGRRGLEEAMEEPGWEGKRTDYWRGLLGQRIRNYEVEYDGGSALWQSPVPLTQSGLFSLRTKLCEHVATKSSGKLTDANSLTTWWYSLTPKPEPAASAKKKASESLEGDDKGDGDEARLPAPSPPEPDTLKTYEHFLFLGTCVRNAQGLFPCPVSGLQKMLPATEPGGSGLSDGSKIGKDLFEFEVSFNGKVWISDNPIPEMQRTCKEYRISDSGGEC